MAKVTLEKLADRIIRLSPEEAEELSLIMRAKLMPEQARQQGLLQQQQQQQPITQQQAAMGQRPGGRMQMPTSRMAAQQGLLR
jgi:hypothetical protein